MRGLLAICLGSLIACMPCPSVAAARPAIDARILSVPAEDLSAAAVTSGAFDSRLEPFDQRSARLRKGVYWLKFRLADGVAPPSSPALAFREGRRLRVDLFTSRAGTYAPVPRAAVLPEFRGTRDTVFVVPDAGTAGQSIYARVEVFGPSSYALRFSLSSLDEALARGAEHARMITLTFGALMAMALAALLFWFVLSDKLILLYAMLIALQAVYAVYLSGQGFYWPVLSAAWPLGSYAWNVPAALSGAVACLFVREIADLRRFSPRVHRIFGWMAVAFVVLTVANLAQHIGLESIVVTIGNIVFLGSAVFTLIVAFLAWRRNSRAAGWFLIAWGLLEAFTIATAIRLLITDGEEAESLLYFGLPLSMIAAAVLIALGVADRLREQRLALTEAERRAQTDPLTGVLNRRSLIERLDAECQRARAHDLPIALLFIDLDHFKQINDSRGHLAGDACLQAIIAPVQAELRQSDIIGRYGGEEFVVVLTGADAMAAHPIAERILRRIADVRVEGFGEPIQLTCSIGVATSDTLGVWGEHLIARADAAVYAAKRSGRNRVQMAKPMAA